MPLVITPVSTADRMPPARFTVTVTGGGKSWPLGPFPVATAYPPSRWEDRERLDGRYRLALPAELEDGSYALGLEVPGADQVLPLGTVAVSGGKRQFEAPPIAHPLDLELGAAARLAG